MQIQNKKRKNPRYKTEKRPKSPKKDRKARKKTEKPEKRPESPETNRKTRKSRQAGNQRKRAAGRPGKTGKPEDPGKRASRKTRKSKQTGRPGKTGKPEDPGKQASRKPGKTGKPGTRENGQAGRPGKTGKPEDPKKQASRKTGKTGKPGTRENGQTGNPGKRASRKPEKTGKPEDPGKRANRKPGKTGKPEDPGKQANRKPEKTSKPEDPKKQASRKPGKTGKPENQNHKNKTTSHMNRKTMKQILLAWGMSLLPLLPQAGTAQTARRSITLDEAILLARVQSVDAAVALNELKTAYWEYRTFQANLLPEISFTATLPSYNKKYNSYQQDNGAYTYVRNDYMNLSGSISIDQSIWLTGGTLSLTTSLDYLSQLSGNKSRQFMSVPVALTLNQPIFSVNNVKWNRRIEPVRYEEAKAAFLSATENVTLNTINHFFNLLLARERVNISSQNLENARKLYEVAKVKRRMGKISENDLLQLQLNMLNAESALTDNESSLKNAMFTLRSFLALEGQEELDPVLPDSIPGGLLNYQDVLEKALANNSFARNIRRRQLEADYEVAKARGNLREITLFAQVGYTGTDHSFRSSYQHLKDNQVVEVGIRIPLLDWGKRRGQVRVAESNRQVTESKLRQETMDFNQNLFILTEQFNNQKRQLKIAGEADRIARKRYHTNVETFMVGQISTLDLNDAQVSKDEARQKHINELFYYWYYYYQLRSLTLWDFDRNTGIDADFEEIIRRE